MDACIKVQTKRSSSVKEESHRNTMQGSRQAIHVLRLD